MTSPVFCTQQLSPHFSLYDLLRSETAERQARLLEAQMNPPEHIKRHLQHLVEATLEPIRVQFNYPMRVTSGYRSQRLNRAMGGAPNSPHEIGQAVDILISDGFLTDDRTADLRAEISDSVKAITGKPIRAVVNANYYLFAFLCLHLNKFDVDEVGHEYGLCAGQCAWVHIAASEQDNRRIIHARGHYVKNDQDRPDLATALSFGV